MLAGKGSYDEQGGDQSFTPSNAVFGTGESTPAHGRRVGRRLHHPRRLVRSHGVGEVDLRRALRARDTLPLVRLVDTAGGSVKLLDKRRPPRSPAIPPGRWSQLLAQVPVVGVALGACAGLGALRGGRCPISRSWSAAPGQVFAGGPPVVKQAHRHRHRQGDPRRLRTVHRCSGVVDQRADSEDEAFAAGAALPVLPAAQRLGSRRIAGLRDDPALARRLAQHTRSRRTSARSSTAAQDPQGALRRGLRCSRSARLSAARSITCLARLNGCAVGVMCNDPRVMGGALTRARGAEDGALRRPLRHLPPADRQPGRPARRDDRPGRRTRRHDGCGAAGLHAIEQLGVPWVSIIMRRAFGLAGAMQGP